MWRGGRERSSRQFFSITHRLICDRKEKRREDSKRKIKRFQSNSPNNSSRTVPEDEV
jgi:hypothetical protein